MLISDPHAWLYSLFARLSEKHTFRLLSPSHQFELFRAEWLDLTPPHSMRSTRDWIGARIQCRDRLGRVIHEYGLAA